jgi:hypothetical protein
MLFAGNNYNHVTFKKFCSYIRQIEDRICTSVISCSQEDDVMMIVTAATTAITNKQNKTISNKICNIFTIAS